LSGELAQARASLTVMRQQLSDAYAILSDIRRLLGGEAQRPAESEGTPAVTRAQEEAKAG
jgi:hypothetical protein